MSRTLYLSLWDLCRSQGDIYVVPFWEVANGEVSRVQSLTFIHATYELIRMRISVCLRFLGFLQIMGRYPFASIYNVPLVVRSTQWGSDWNVISYIPSHYLGSGLTLSFSLALSIYISCYFCVQVQGLCESSEAICLLQNVIQFIP